MKAMPLLIFVTGIAFGAGQDKSVADLLAESGSSLSHAQLEQFRDLLENDHLLSNKHISIATINAVGELLLRANDDDAFQQRQLDDLSDLWTRIGIDVDPEGFAYLADSVERAHGRQPIFGALPAINGSEVIPPKEYVDTARDRIGLPPLRVFYAEVNRKLIAGATADTALRRPLALRKPQYPTNWALFAELVQLARTDQSVREGKIDKDRMQEVDSKDHDELAKIIHDHGYPDSAAVGRFGVIAIWLVVQHQINDPALMKNYRKHAKVAMEHGELPHVSYALLDDRIRCYIDGELEIYGTQSGGVDEKGPFIPVADPQHVNALRASMLMMPMDLSKARGDCKTMQANFNPKKVTVPAP